MKEHFHVGIYAFGIVLSLLIWAVITAVVVGTGYGILWLLGAV
jgi:hypothetical protein